MTRETLHTFRRGIAAAMAFISFAAAPGMAAAETVLITGANSGIGLEFARQYAADGWHVIATHRRSDVPETLAELTGRYPKVRVETLDVTDHASIDALASELRGMPIDVLLNNAGIVGGVGDPDQSFGSLDYATLDRFLQTNTVGPLKIAEAFHDNVKAAKHGKIVAISTIAASLDFASRGGPQAVGLSFRYAYAISKAGLNMAYAGLAHDVRDSGISVLLIHPGLVRVARTEKYPMSPQMEAAMLDVDVAVRQMRKTIAALTPATSGRFVANDGAEVPW